MLSSLGVKKGMVVFGRDKLDEISGSSDTFVCEVDNGKYSSYTICPEDFGLKRCTKADLVGGEAAVNAKITESILEGEKGPRRDVVLMNAAAGLYCSGKAKSMADGVELAANLIDNGDATDILKRYRLCSQ